VSSSCFTIMGPHPTRGDVKVCFQSLWRLGMFDGRRWPNPECPLLYRGIRTRSKDSWRPLRLSPRLEVIISEAGIVVPKVVRRPH
jgi:hypothetical protein